MPTSEFMACMRCGLRGKTINMRRISFPQITLSLCPLCWEGFWQWFGGRNSHCPEGGRAIPNNDLGLGLCLICQCELERWLHPVQSPRRSAPEVAHVETVLGRPGATA